MKRLFDANGVAIKTPSVTAEGALDAAMDAMTGSLEDSLMGVGPESRVSELRESVLGKEATPAPRMLGLSAFLSGERPEE